MSPAARIPSRDETTCAAPGCANPVTAPTAAAPTSP